MLKWIRTKKAVKAMQEPQPLPMGRQEFEEWSDRIIALAAIPGATVDSLKFALADMVLHVKPTESFVCDGYFIHCLRKGAANEVAISVFRELKEKRNGEAKVLADAKV